MSIRQTRIALYPGLNSPQHELWLMNAVEKSGAFSLEVSEVRGLTVYRAVQKDAVQPAVLPSQTCRAIAQKDWVLAVANEPMDYLVTNTPVKIAVVYSLPGRDPARSSLELSRFLYANRRRLETHWLVARTPLLHAVVNPNFKLIVFLERTVDENLVRQVLQDTSQAKVFAVTTDKKEAREIQEWGIKRVKVFADLPYGTSLPPDVADYRKLSEQIWHLCLTPWEKILWRLPATRRFARPENLERI